jgi:hypothetical protein
MIPKKRVVLIHWKNKPENPFEVFSSLKNFCLSYPAHNYNTLSNYLSKAKIPYDNPDIRIERMNVILKPKPLGTQVPGRSIAPVVRTVALHKAADAKNDLSFWLTKTPLQRLSALTAIVSSSMPKSNRLDKSKLEKRKLKS